MKLHNRIRRKIVGLAVASALAMAYAYPAMAQTACSPTPSGAVALNCTTRSCSLEMCWSTPQTGLTGCKAYITGPGGAMPGITGAVVNTSLCRVALPLLTTTGNYSIRGSGINAFGEGAQSTDPLALQTGLPQGAPNGLAVQ